VDKQNIEIYISIYGKAKSLTSKRRNAWDD